MGISSAGNFCQYCYDRDSHLGIAVGKSEKTWYERRLLVLATAIAGTLVLVVGGLFNAWLAADSDNGMIFWFIPLIPVYFLLTALLITLPLWLIPSLMESMLLQKILNSGRIRLRHIFIINMWAVIAIFLFAISSKWLAQVVDFPPTGIGGILDFRLNILPGLVITFGIIPVLWSVGTSVLSHKLKKHRKIVFTSTAIVAIISLVAIVTFTNSANYTYTYQQCQESFDRFNPDGIGYLSCDGNGYHISIGDEAAAKKKKQQLADQKQKAQAEAEAKKEQEPTEAEKRATKLDAVLFTPYGLSATEGAQVTLMEKTLVSMRGSSARATNGGWHVWFQVQYQKDSIHHFHLQEIQQDTITAACVSGRLALDLGPCTYLATTPGGIKVYQYTNGWDGKYYFMKDGVLFYFELDYRDAGPSDMLQYSIPFIDRLHPL